MKEIKNEILSELIAENTELKKINKEMLYLLVLATIKAGYSPESREYKTMLGMAGYRYIIITKIQNGVALTDKEKEYLTNNLG